MIYRLFLIAALVMFIFALIASLASDGLCLSESFSVWAAAGFIAFVADCLFGGWVTASIQRQPPA